MSAARVTQEALEVCGGQGYTPALPIERHLRDARAGAVMAPTNGVLRTWSARPSRGFRFHERRGRRDLVGAVAYHPRIVTIWERFRDYFADAGVPTDYILFSNYERLVDALLDGRSTSRWNTNTAYVARDHRRGGRDADPRDARRRRATWRPCS